MGRINSFSPPNPVLFRNGVKKKEIVLEISGKVMPIKMEAKCLGMLLGNTFRHTQIKKCIQRAFCVQHNILLGTLEILGIRGFPLQCFASYLSDNVNSLKSMFAKIILI